jgi:hypothetical protein
LSTKTSGLTSSSNSWFVFSTISGKYHEIFDKIYFDNFQTALNFYLMLVSIKVAQENTLDLPENHLFLWLTWDLYDLIPSQK